MRLDSFTTPLLGLALACLLLSGCLDSAGGQDDDGSGQFATATAIGLPPAAAGGFAARTESEVTLSGKDSDSPSSPIFAFDWEQTSGPPVDLFERDASSRSFTAPAVASVLEFRLTVTNVNGEMTSDTVTIEVEEIIDTNEFLRDPTVNEELFLFVSPAASGEVLSTTSYSLTVSPVVRWTGRDGLPGEIELDPILETCDDMGVCDEILSGFMAPSDPVDRSQTRHSLKVPLLDFDEVNEFFQGDQRGGRLEFEEVDNATVELQISFSSVAGSTDLEVFVARESDPFRVVEAGFVLCERENADLEITEFCRRDAPPQDIPDLPRDAILDGSRSDARLDLEALRQELAFESKASATNYYDCIDPNREATTLDDWLEQAGFNDPANQNGITRARYLNNYDLGFGRDMFLRTDADGNVFTYVVNYPSLESLLKASGEFATVVMEYSPALEVGENCGSTTFSPTEKIVKFYAYSPNSLTGQMERTLSQNFDGRGERFLPGVCTACHDGDPASIMSFNPVIPASAAAPRSTQTDILGASADLLATFMPWDLDSMLYARAADPSLVDPSLTQSEFTSGQLDEVSLETQQDAFRALNEGALATYLNSPEELRRFEAPLRLVHGWYGKTFSFDDPIESNPIEDLAMLNDQVFDGDFVEEGWLGQEELYRGSYTRYCRMCHVQQDNFDLNFDTYDEFIGTSSLSSQVFGTGRMPRSRLTMDRFWLDFDGAPEADSGAGLLRTHLGISDTTRPGQPFAAPAVVDPVVDPLGPEITAVDITGALIPTTVTLDGSESLVADEFLWTVTAGGDFCPTPGTLTVDGEQNPQASFLADQSPCVFSANLEVRSGDESSNADVEVESDRAPVAAAFVAPVDLYTPGDTSLDIDIGAQDAVANFGDPPLSFFTTDPDVTIAGDIATITFPGLAGINRTFQYSVEDVDFSDEGGGPTADITVAIDPIDIVLSLNGAIVDNTVNLVWTAPDGFVASSYSLEREGPARDGNFIDVPSCSPIPVTECTSIPGPCTCEDSDLLSGEEYVYRVVTRLGVEDPSLSNDLRVSTLAVPQGVNAVEVEAGVGPQVNVTWAFGGATAPDSYRVYRSVEGGAQEAPIGVAVPSLADTDIDQNTLYEYSISQLDLSGESAQSAPFAIITDVEGPANLIVSPQPDTTDTIDVSWEGPEFGTVLASGDYTIERRLEGGGGGFVEIMPEISTAGVPAMFSFSDSALEPDTEYTYRITANGRNGTTPEDSALARTNVSFEINIEDLSDGNFDPGDTPGTCIDCAFILTSSSCINCHSLPPSTAPILGLTEFESYLRENPGGCINNLVGGVPDLSLVDCSPISHASTNPRMNAAMFELLDRWLNGGALPEFVP